VALVISPANSMKASGDLGAINYTHIRGIQIARSKYTSIQPNSGSQATMQGNLSTAVYIWRDVLTDEQIQLWNQAAAEQRFINRMGNPFIPSGFSYFMRIYLRLYAAGLTPAKTPPRDTIAVKPMNLTSTITTSPPNVQLSMKDYSGSALSVTKIQINRAGPYEGYSRRPQLNDFRILSYTASSTYDDSTVILGRVYYYRVRWLRSSGKMGNTIQLIAEVPSA